MVRSNDKPSSNSGKTGSDDDWDVVDPHTAAVMRPDNDGETSKDRLSFVMVGDSMVPARMRAAANAEPAAAAVPPHDPAPAAAPPVAAEPEPLETAPAADAIGSVPPLQATPPSAAVEETTPAAAATPAPPKAAVAAPAPVDEHIDDAPDAKARRLMDVSPELPGTKPPATRAVPPPPAAVLTAPPSRSPAPDARTLRTTSSLTSEEATLRQIVHREHDAEYRRIVNEWRLERQRLGDAEARAAAANDAAIARRLQEEEQRRAAEEARRLQEEEERRTFEALEAERRAAMNSRAAAGARKCECLGGPAGHHRPACPLRNRPGEDGSS